MKETKHTPGEWQYISGDEFHGPFVTSDVGDVCDLYVMSKPSGLSTLNGGASEPVVFQPKFAEANARLIAAAPDLLEACRALIAVFHAKSVLSDCLIRTETDAIRAAIAKATGSDDA